MASGPAEETAALNRFRQNPFHAGGLAELEYQELRLRVPFLPGRARRPARGSVPWETSEPSRPLAQSSLGMMTAGRFQRSDGEGIVET